MERGVSRGEQWSHRSQGREGFFHRSVSRAIEGLRKKGPDDSATFLHGIKTYLLFFFLVEMQFSSRLMNSIMECTNFQRMYIRLGTNKNEYTFCKNKH